MPYGRGRRVPARHVSMHFPGISGSFTFCAFALRLCEAYANELP